MIFSYISGKPISFALFISLLSSCELLDTKPVPVPAYIYIDSVQFLRNDLITDYQGGFTHKFVDVWLTQEGISLGNIGMPTFIPVQKTGHTTISVEPGIFKSGQDDQRIIYPFIQTVEEVVDLVPGKIDTIRPVYKYFTNTLFPLVEDFDRDFFQFDYNPLYHVAGDTIVKVFEDSVRKNVGQVNLSDASEVFQIYTVKWFNALPQFNAPVYWEMDYKTDCYLYFGYYIDGPSGGAPNKMITLNPTSGKWNKVYISLAEEIAGKNTGTAFRFYIGLTKEAGSKVNVFLDNMKLVHL